MRVSDKVNCSNQEEKVGSSGEVNGVTNVTEIMNVIKLIGTGKGGDQCGSRVETWMKLLFLAEGVDVIMGRQGKR